MNQTATQLFVVTPDKSVELGASLLAFAQTYGQSSSAVALLYTPTRCVFARIDGTGNLEFAPKSETVELADVFEARVFHDGGDGSTGAELRWVEDPRGDQHRAAILTEIEPIPMIAGWQTSETIPCVAVLDTKGRLDQQYLLWGESLGPSASGWVKLATAQIGTISVPCGGVTKAKQRVRLKTREYFKEYEHGNVAVFDERLVRLEVYRMHGESDDE